jgi:hypothetical protein
VRDGKVLPFSEVACDRVVQLLPDAPNRQSILGKALARVLAHELYHALADVTRHASEGIAKATLAAVDLATGTIKFDTTASALLRRQ